MSLQSEPNKANSLEQQRKLLNAQFGNSDWSDQGLSNKWTNEEQSHTLEASEKGGNDSKSTGTD